MDRVFEFGVGIVDNDYCSSMMMTMTLQRRLPVGKVLWQCENAQSVLEHICFDDELPSVVVLDMMLNGISGIDVCRSIRSRTPNIGIVCVTAYPLHTFIDTLVAVGAQSLLSKRDVASEAFVRAVKEAAHGNPYPSDAPFLRTDLAYKKMKEYYGNYSNKVTIPTLHELEVMRCYGQNMTTEEIAGIMHIAPSTVFSHVHHVLTKVHAKNRREALSICRKLNLL